MFHRLAAPVLAASALWAATGAWAAEVEINPVVITLQPGARSAIVKLRNLGQEPARFEVQARAWSQSPAGEMELSATEEIAVYPPMLTLAPGEERNLRIGAVVPFGPVEKSYRVFLQELAPPAGPDTPAQVRVLSRIGLPVFLAPPNPTEQASIRGLTARNGTITFQLSSEGTAHVRPASVKVVAAGEDGATVLESEVPAWYVLAGGRREYRVEIPPTACGSIRSVAVTAQFPRGDVREQVAVTSPCVP